MKTCKVCERLTVPNVSREYVEQRVWELLRETETALASYSDSDPQQIITPLWNSRVLAAEFYAALKSICKHCLSHGIREFVDESGQFSTHPWLIALTDEAYRAETAQRSRERQDGELLDPEETADAYDRRP